MSHTPSQASSSLLRCNASSAALASIRSITKQGVKCLRSKGENFQTRTCGAFGDSPISWKDLNRRDLDSKSITSFGKCRPRYDAIPPSPLAGARRSTKSSSSRVSSCTPSVPISKASRFSLLKRRLDSSDNEDLDSHPGDVKGSERPSKRMRTEIESSHLHSDGRVSSCSKSVVESNPAVVVNSPQAQISSKWQSPRTSPLGPRTSRYRRRSKQSSQPARRPTKATSNLAIQCVLRAFQHDNVNRDPSRQSPQWCEDLLVTGLKDYFHPNYQCQHMFHPSDPEYDEEWSDETWSDEEWSDSEDDEEFEDCLPSPPDTGDVGDIDMDVTILAPEENTPQVNSDLELDIKSHWTKWHTSPKCHSSVSLPWRPELDVRSEKARSVAISI